MDDEIALKCVEFWIKNYGNKEMYWKVPDELKNIDIFRDDRTRNEQIKNLRLPYEQQTGEMTKESFRRLLYDIKNRMVIRKTEEKRHKQYEKWQKIVSVIMIITVFIAFVTLILNSNITKDTTRIAEINEKLLQREELLDKAHLSLWQTDAEIFSKSDLILRGGGWENTRQLRICFINDGRSSTGPINIDSNSNIFKIQHKYQRNLIPHESNCTYQGIYFCDNYTECKDQIPTGELNLTMSLGCAYCGTNYYTMNISICIFNHSGSECDEYEKKFYNPYK